MNQLLSVLTLECQTVHLLHVCLFDTCLHVCVDLLGEMAAQHFLAHWLFRQSQPELAGLQGNVLILILSSLQHVLWRHREHFELKGCIHYLDNNITVVQKVAAAPVYQLALMKKTICFVSNDTLWYLSLCLCLYKIVNQHTVLKIDSN